MQEDEVSMFLTPFNRSPSFKRKAKGSTNNLGAWTSLMYPNFIVCFWLYVPGLLLPVLWLALRLGNGVLLLLPRLECNGMISAHHNLCLTGSKSCSVARLECTERSWLTATSASRVQQRKDWRLEGERNVSVLHGRCTGSLRPTAADPIIFQVPPNGHTFHPPSEDENTANTLPNSKS
ncbi:hypothetical protein AAY473_005302 [Plecturocebus cupreus]